MAKILLNSIDVIGKTMAGPSIRYWEFAKALSKNHEVILLIPNEIEVSSNDFTIIQKTANYRKYFKQVDAIITMSVSPSMAWAAKRHGVKIIFDAYVPMPIEMFEMHKDSPMELRKKEQKTISEAFNFSFRMADGVICANASQRDLWTGMLLSQKKIDPAMYDNDILLKNVIDLVPFGLSSTPPQKKGEGPKSIFNLKETDKIVLWGGGIWNWFDPLTLIKAIHQISLVRKDIHLVFMGVKVPSTCPDTQFIMNMPSRAYELAKELNLLNRHVFFNPGWTPYEQRTSFLLESDIGVSTHYDHLETRYAFRTRILDYIWAGLPIISTEGDSFSKLVAEKEIGLVVPYEDSHAIAKAITYIIDNPQIVKKMKENLETVRQEFYWEKLVRPIEEMIASKQPIKSKWADLKHIIHSVYQVRGALFPFKIVMNRILQRLGLVRI